MERANLKVRCKDVYDRIVAEWHEWNSIMLPEIDEAPLAAIPANNWPTTSARKRQVAKRTILRHPKRRRQNLIENQ